MKSNLLRKKTSWSITLASLLLLLTACGQNPTAPELEPISTSTPIPPSTPVVTGTTTPVASTTATPQVTPSPTPIITPTPIPTVVTIIQDLMPSGDTQISQKDRDDNFGSNAYLYADQVANIEKILIKFNVAIPHTATIDSIVLTIENNIKYNFASEYYHIKRITRPWNEYEATWNQAMTGQPWSTYGGGGDYQSFTRFKSEQGEQAIDLTASLINNYSINQINELFNMGILIQASSYNTGFLYLKSREAVTSTPRLTIKYYQHN